MPEYGRNGNTLNLSALQLKFKLASEWNANDVLLAGEIGVEKDTHKAKIGDGLTGWGALPYSADPTVQTLVDTLTQRVSDAESTVTSHGTRLDTAEAAITAQGTRLTTAETAIEAAEGRLDTAEADIDTAEADIDALEGRATALEAKDVTHESRMTAIEAKDTEQDGRLSALEGITIISANPFRE